MKGKPQNCINSKHVTAGFGEIGCVMTNAGCPQSLMRIGDIGAKCVLAGRVVVRGIATGHITDQLLSARLLVTNVSQKGVYEYNAASAQ